MGYVRNAAEAKLASTTPFARVEHARLVLRQQLCHVKVVYLKNPTRSLKYWNSSRCGLETSVYDGARTEVSSLLQLTFPWTSSRLLSLPLPAPVAPSSQVRLACVSQLLSLSAHVVPLGQPLFQLSQEQAFLVRLVALHLAILSPLPPHELFRPSILPFEAFYR